MKNAFSTAINITNKNVYLTNILLLPALLYSILGIQDIHGWTDVPRDKSFHVYLSLWYALAILIIFVIIFSTIYHGFMYDYSKTTLQLLGKVDHKFTAPLFSLIILLLNFIYFLFLNKPCPRSDDSLVIYIVALLFNGIGMISWVLKRFVYYPHYQRGKFIQKIKYFMAHTFFHYVAYTGVTLLMTLYYIDNKEIYEGLILNKCYT
jgi:hypothetical protein